MTVGERIKARRKELGLSADYVAEKLNVSRSTVFRYENGSIEKLPADALEPIAAVLHTSVAALMGWEFDPDGKSFVNFTLPQDKLDEIFLLDLFRKLPESDRDMVLQMIRAALESKGLL